MKHISVNAQLLANASGVNVLSMPATEHLMNISLKVAWLLEQHHFLMSILVRKPKGCKKHYFRDNQTVLLNNEKEIRFD